eukprot:347016-Chlamydomonas_euryale.AAC.13
MQSACDASAGWPAVARARRRRLPLGRGRRDRRRLLPGRGECGGWRKGEGASGAAPPPATAPRRCVEVCGRRNASEGAGQRACARGARAAAKLSACAVALFGDAADAAADGGVGTARRGRLRMGSHGRLLLLLVQRKMTDGWC